jgi:hypothetical protein
MAESAFSFAVRSVEMLWVANALAADLSGSN